MRRLDEPRRRVDAHHHVWRLDRGDYGWLTPELAPIYRDFGLSDLRPLLASVGIETTVLVQAAATVAETEYLLGVARESGGLVAAVVGWIDFAAADALATLDRFRGTQLRSIRPMLQDIPDPAWILRGEVQPILAALPSLGLRFDALIKPLQLPSLLRMQERHADLDLVIDHGAKPAIASGQWEPWASQVAQLAENPRAFCKLSGLTTEARSDWSSDVLRRYVDHLIESFGTRRLLWGSDWPVVALAGGYQRWFDATLDLLSGLSIEDREAILGANARRFYGLSGV